MSPSESSKIKHPNFKVNLFVPDQPSDADFLDYSPYVLALVNQLSDSKTQTPLTLGIFGTWGSGKTTLMKLMQKEFEKKRKRKSESAVETLWVNVWQLSSQSELWNAFLQALFTHVHSRLSFWSRLKFDWGLLRDRIDSKELVRQLIVNSYRIIAVITPLILVALLPPDSIQNGAPATLPDLLRYVLDPVTGGIASLIIGYFLILKPIFEAAKVKTSVDLNKILKEPAFETQISALQKLQNQFEKMVQAWVGENGRVVIFIDDLDRCTPDKIAEVLEALKLFATTRGCIYVLGVDYQVVARAIQVKYKEFSSPHSEHTPVDGMRYLEKIIQLPFLLPLLDIDDIAKYLNSFKVKWPHPGVTDTFARGLPPNPRMIKRATNVYLLLWQLAETGKHQKRVGGYITALRLAKPLSQST